MRPRMLFGVRVRACSRVVAYEEHAKCVETKLGFFEGGKLEHRSSGVGLHSGPGNEGDGDHRRRLYKRNRPQGPAKANSW